MAAGSTLNRQSVLALIEKQYPGLLALLRRKLRDEQLAQDALNQALVTSLEHMQAGRIADPSQIGGYVFQVAMNQLRNHRRKMIERADRRADADAAENLSSDSDNVEVAVGELGRQVHEILAGLPTSRDRELVKRFYLDEEEKQAICLDLGLSPLHFDKVIFRARQRMRALLEAKGFKKSDFFGFLVVCFA
jgi:RNA polymerase sigma-70 factor (ECF subfamily)